MGGLGSLGIGTFEPRVGQLHASLGRQISDLALKHDFLPQWLYQRLYSGVRLSFRKGDIQHARPLFEPPEEPDWILEVVGQISGREAWTALPLEGPLE